MTQVLLTVPIQQNIFTNIVDTFSNVTFHLYPNGSLRNLPLLSQCEVLAIFGNDFDSGILQRMPGLRMLQTFRAGVDNLPVKDLHNRGVIVCNVRGIQRNSVSEYVFGCILAASLNLFTFRENQRAGIWFRNVNRDELFQKTIGIIGAGSIGREVARKAKAFGMYTLGLNRSGNPAEYFDRMYSPAAVGELLAAGDFIVLALPLTDATRHFMDEEKFALMKPASCFINIARGRVTKETALINALKEKKIKTAILDVFEEEPLPANSVLWSMDNVILTPHIAWVSPYYVERAVEIFKHNLSVYLSGGHNYMNMVDLARGY